MPTQVNFELTYAPVNGQWRLFGISVNLGSSAPVAPAPPSAPATAAKNAVPAAAPKGASEVIHAPAPSPTSGNRKSSYAAPGPPML